MSYKVSENKKAEWKEQAKENQNQARELILSVSKSYTENPEKMAEVLEFASRFYQYSYIICSLSMPRIIMLRLCSLLMPGKKWMLM